MKQVQLNTRVYYVGSRYIPFLKNPKYGEFPLKEDKGVQFFDVPTPYAKSLAEGSPALFSLELETVTQYDEYTLDNLRKYAEQRELSFHPNIGKEKLIEKLIQQDKKDNPEAKADDLK